MRRIGMVAVVVLCLAGASYATGTLNPTNGLDVYYEQTYVTSPDGAFSRWEIYRTRVLPGWTLDSASVLVDNITASNASDAGWGAANFRNKGGPTMFTPKADPITGAATGGAGTIAIIAHVPGELAKDPGGAFYQVPTAIINVTPNVADPGNVANYSLLTKGSMGDGFTQSVYSGYLVTAPNNLGGTNSHGTALWFADEPGWGGTGYYMYDASNNGTIDNNTTAGMAETIGMSGSVSKKASWGPDSAIYKVATVNTSHVGILRQYITPGGTSSTDNVYVDVNNLQAANPWIGDNINLGGGVYPYMLGMAVGPSHTNGVTAPIIYFGTMTNTTDESDPNVNSTKISIVAVQDMDADNVVTTGGPDTVTLLWRSTQFGLSMSFDYGNNEDLYLPYISYDSVSQSIVMTNAWGQFGVICLDNTTGKSVVGAIGFGGTQSGFLGGANRLALDPTPFASTEIPEPATLLLVGTGALGALGYIRRRKMV